MKKEKKTLISAKHQPTVGDGTHALWQQKLLFLLPFFHCDTCITGSKTRSEVHLTNVAPLSLIHPGLVVTWEPPTVARSAVKQNNWTKSVLVKFPPQPDGEVKAGEICR